MFGYTPQSMSDECFDAWTGRFGWGFLILAVFVVLIYIAGRIFLNKSGDSKIKKRLNNLKFWFATWLIVFLPATYFATNAYRDQEFINYIEKCHFRAYDSWVSNNLYTGWFFIVFLIIPIMFEYWSIKSGKKNLSKSKISTSTTAIVLVIFTAVVIFIFYHYFRRITQQ